MSITSCSVNSNALCIKLLSSSSIPPSSVASSTIESNSSSVIPSASEDLKINDNNFFHKPNRKLNGVSTLTNIFKIGAENIANFSGDSFAILFGEISPKISTTIVVTAVDTLGPASSPNILTKSTVAKDALAIFTILFPIKIVDNKLS